MELNSQPNNINAEAEQTQEAVRAAEEVALTEEQETAEVMEEMPVLVPDDYDTEEIDYTEGTSLSDVVSAKEKIEEAPRYEHPKLKGKEAWDNFWYHHKTKVIVIGLMTILLGAATIMSIPPKFDNIFNIYADVNLGIYSKDEITDQLLPYCEDSDGNGEVNINVIINNIYSMADPYSSVAGYMSLDTELGGGHDSFLWIIDRAHYDYIVTELSDDVFEPYDEGYPLAISLKDVELVTSVSAAAGNSKELFLVLVKMPEDKMDDAKMVMRHDSARAVLGRIIEAYPELKAQAE